MEKRAPLPELPQLAHCRAQLRTHDRDRYLASLYLPTPLRELCWVLGAFNIEVARVAEAVSEPTIGQIRLKWWREVLETAENPSAAVREHPVAQSLTQIIRHYPLPTQALEALINAREQDLNKGVLFEHIRGLDHYATATGGLWVPLAALHEDEAERQPLRDALQSLGQHWALIGLIRATGHHLQAGKSTIPQQMLLAHELSAEALLDSAEPELLIHLVETLIQRLEMGLERLEKVLAALPGGFHHFGASLAICCYYEKILRKQPENALILSPSSTASPLGLQWHLLKYGLFASPQKKGPLLDNGPS